MRFEALSYCLLTAALAFSFVLSSAPGHAEPRAVNGLLDLRSWDFDREGVVPLNGEWKFTWKRFVPAPSEPGSAQTNGGRVMPVPAVWNDHLPAAADDGGSGFATYRLRILLKATSVPFSVYIPEAGTAYTLFVDGVQRLCAGRPGATPSQTVPAYASKSVSFMPRGEEVELVLWVANFHHRHGGLWEKVFFGPSDQVHARRIQSTAIDLFLFGAILISGLYNLVLFAIRRQERYPLFFALFCLLMALRVLVTGERFINMLLPFIPWGLMIRVEYLTFYLGGCAFALFIHSLFPEEFRRGPLEAVLLLASSLVLLVVASPPGVFTHSLWAAQALTLAWLLYASAALVLAFLRNRQGAAVFLIGLLFFSAAVIHDILYARGVIQSFYVFHVGIAAMMLSLAWVVSKRVALAFEVIDRQQSELNATNQSLRQELEEREKAEARLAEYSEELEAMAEERSRSLQKAHDALIRREKLATLGRLAGGVGHELRNPLGAIQNSTYFLKMTLEAPSREIREALEILDRETGRSEKIIASLFSLADPGKPQIHQGIDLHVLLRHVLARTPLPASVTVDDRLESSLSGIDADPDQMEQVFGNLLRNAVQAMWESGTLTIRSGKTDEGGVEVEVSDTGAGIPEENLETVFEPLFTTKAKGIGLGLALCKSHVEAHGGTITVESEEGKGTTFTVRLPGVQGNCRETENGIHKWENDGSH